MLRLSHCWGGAERGTWPSAPGSCSADGNGADLVQLQTCVTPASFSTEHEEALLAGAGPSQSDLGRISDGPIFDPPTVDAAAPCISWPWTTHIVDRGVLHACLRVPPRAKVTGACTEVNAWLELE